jgi:nucleotide-binding universal stress UspA family protein
MPSAVGLLIAVVFLIVLGGALLWMLRLPRPLAREAARAVFSVEAARCIVVPILDLFYTERAVEVACRLGHHQGATIVLAYVVRIPRVLTLDAPLPRDVEERAREALAEAQQIVDRHGLRAVPLTVRAREIDEGIRRTVRAYGGDVVVLGMTGAEPALPTMFTRTAEELLRRPPCEVIVDKVPA